MTHLWMFFAFYFLSKAGDYLDEIEIVQLTKR